MLTLCTAMVVIFSQPYPSVEVVATAPVAPTTRSWRIMTWNIQGCAAGLGPVLRELDSAKPDIIFLQEAELGTEHVNRADQAALIAQKLRMHHVSAGSSLGAGKGEQHMAILARGQLTDAQALEAGTGRAYGVTAVVRLGEQPVRLVCVHLTNNYWQGLRPGPSDERPSVREATDLAGRVRSWSGSILLGGDFNAVPGMREHTVVSSYLSRVPATQPTYPANQPMLTIDQVYHSVDVRIMRLTVPRSTASDHLPVVVDIRLISRPTTLPAE